MNIQFYLHRRQAEFAIKQESHRRCIFKKSFRYSCPRYHTITIMAGVLIRRRTRPEDLKIQMLNIKIK